MKERICADVAQRTTSAPSGIPNTAPTRNGISRWMSDRMSQLAKRATLDDDGKSSDQRDTLRRCYDVEPNRRCDQSECETSKSGNKRAYEGRNEIDD